MRSDFWRHTGSFTVTTAETGAKVITYATAGTYLAAPKLVRFWNGIRNSSGQGDHAALRIGFADHTLSQGCLSAFMQDGRTTTTTEQTWIRSDIAYVGGDQNGGGNPDGAFSVTAMGDGTFTINISNAFNSNARIFFEVLGGTDFDAQVVPMTIPSGTGTFSGGALNFTPEAVEAVMGLGAATAFGNNTSGASFSRGFAAGATQGCIAACSDAVVSTPTGRSLITDQRLVVAPTENADTIHTALSLSSFDATGHGGGSSPGITFNKNTGAVATPFIYVAMKGAKFAVKHTTTRTNTTPWAETVWPNTSHITYGVTVLGAPPLTALSTTPSGEVSLAMGAWGPGVAAEDVAAFPLVFGGTTSGDASGIYANEAEVGALSGGNPSDSAHIVAAGGGSPAGDIYLHYTRTGANTWSKTGTMKVDQTAAASFDQVGLVMTDADDAAHPIILFAISPVVT